MLKTSDGAPTDAGAGVGDLGDPSKAEDAAVLQAFRREPPLSGPKAGGTPPAVDGLQSSAIWANALRGAELGAVEADTDHQRALDATLANNLSKHLSAGDLQAGVDAVAGRGRGAGVPGAGAGAPLIGQPQFRNAGLARQIAGGAPTPGGLGADPRLGGLAPGPALDPLDPADRVRARDEPAARRLCVAAGGKACSGNPDRTSV